MQRVLATHFMIAWHRAPSATLTLLVHIFSCITADWQIGPLADIHSILPQFKNWSTTRASCMANARAHFVCKMGRFPSIFWKHSHYIVPCLLF